jgi:DNA-binding response OmpR family regulator/class 3 adenylate cyclase/predicted ATPase
MESRGVLILADDIGERSLIARALRSGGHPIELAESAKRALKLAKVQKFEVVIVAMSTQSAGEAIVRDLCGFVPKVIALIDPGKNGVRPDHILFPADALLSRPIDQSQLLACITKLKEPSLQPAINDAPSAFSFEGCTFDVAGRTFVDRNGRETELTRSEAQLLATFVRNPKRVLTRDQLRHAIVGRGVEAFDRSVDILVARLRHKIEPDPKAPRFIHTVAGAGYKFTASLQSVEPSKSLSGSVGGMKPEGAFVSQPLNKGPPLTLAPGINAAEFRTEKRQVTVLSCGLANAFAVLGENDLEVVEEAIGAFRDTATEAVAGMGGSIARIAGEEILALFGYPEAREDDAERAIQAGLNLVARFAEVQSSCGAPFPLQTVITTGPILAGHGEDIIGAPLALAARLRIAASPNALLVTAATRKLVRGIFDFEDQVVHEFADVPEPLLLYRVTGRRPARTRFESMHRDGLSAFVGRQKELEQLRSLWEQARDNVGQVALICGEPGIGKSRTFRALLDDIAGERHAVLWCQCSLHNINSPYHPIIRHLEDAVCFDSRDPPDRQIEKLRRALSVAGPVSSLDLALCAALLSIPGDSLNLPPNLTPQRQRNLTNDALVRYILAGARREPLIVKLADAHWVDSSTLELFGRIIGSITTERVFVVASCRPEFFTPWLEHSHVTVLRLNRLERELARNMVLQVAGEPLPDRVCEQILARTDGVPLFVEELTKAIVELGSHRPASGHLGSFSSPPTVPETLADSLMARLDKAGDARAVAQIGSAIGREFSYGLLAAAAGMPAASLHSALVRLAALELIFVRGEAPDSFYIFKHALVQEAAYAALPNSERRQLHNRIARALEDKFPETARTQPEIVAYHLTQAGQPQEAIEYLRIAAQRAIEQSAAAEAVSHLTDALSLLQSLPESARRLRAALRLQTMLALTMIAMRGYAAPQTRETLVRARSLVGDRADCPERLTILYGLWAASYVGGEASEQLSAASELLAAAEQQGDVGAICVAHRSMGTTLLNRGDFASSLPHLQRACALYDPEQHLGLRHQFGQDIGVAALCYLSWALWHLGSPDQAEHIAGEALQRAEKLSHPHTLVYALSHAQCFISILSRRPEGLQACADLVFSLCAEQGFSHWINFGRVCRGWAAICRGEFDPGIEELLAGIAGWRRTGSRLWLPVFQMLEAEAYSKAGRAQAAVQTIEQALEWSKKTGEQWALAELLRLKAHLSSRTGKAGDDDFEHLLRTSLNVAQSQSAHSFELRGACDLARHWQSQGKRNKAVTLLRHSYEKFTEGFETEDLREAGVLIRSLESAHSGPDPAAHKDPASQIWTVA